LLPVTTPHDATKKYVVAVHFGLPLSRCLCNAHAKLSCPESGRMSCNCDLKRFRSVPTCGR
jgi:hypothetical protein